MGRSFHNWSSIRLNLLRAREWWRNLLWSWKFERCIQCIRKKFHHERIRWWVQSYWSNWTLHYHRNFTVSWIVCRTTLLSLVDGLLARSFDVLALGSLPSKSLLGCWFGLGWRRKWRMRCSRRRWPYFTFQLGNRWRSRALIWLGFERIALWWHMWKILNLWWRWNASTWRRI